MHCLLRYFQNCRSFENQNTFRCSENQEKDLKNLHSASKYVSTGKKKVENQGFFLYLDEPKIRWIDPLHQTLAVSQKSYFNLLTVKPIIKKNVSFLLTLFSIRQKACQTQENSTQIYRAKIKTSEVQKLTVIIGDNIEC